MAPNLFSLIPMQDFTDRSDIDWSKSLRDIDQYLYSKYDFDNGEKEYIESTINCYEDEKKKTDIES